MSSYKVCPLTEIAERLKLSLAEAGITASELSRKTGVPKASLSQYTNAKSAPSEVTAEKLAKVLKVSPLWLMGLNVPKEEPIVKLDFTIDEVGLVQTARELDEAQKKRLLAYAEMLAKGIL